MTLRSPRQRPARHLDFAVVRIRWGIAALVLLLSFLDAGSLLPTPLLLGWLAAFALYNLINWVAALLRSVPPKYAEITLGVDTAFFTILPFVSPQSGPLIFLLNLFPAVLAAMRFGPYVGALIAGILALPFEIRTLISIIPAPLRPSTPEIVPLPSDPITIGLLPLMLFSAVFLIGYIAKRERESTLGNAAIELEELRRAVSSAQIFYRTVDALSNTLNYGRVLEGMLDAGIKGLPTARREDGPGVALALFFSEEKSDMSLHVVAWRNLDRGDPTLRIPGKEGIVAETLRTGEPQLFQKVSTDPELSNFGALRRCRGGVSYPLQAGLEQYGVVIIASPTPRLPSADQFEMMSAFTNQAAVAFQNTKLYGSLRSERDRIVDNDARARMKLARDLHDGPIQKVAAASMNTEFVKKLIERDPEKAATELDEMRRLLDATVKEMRDLLFTLRPLTLETEGLSTALRQLVDRLNKSEGINLELKVDKFGPELGETLSGTVFSIIEEAINNARKHAPGARIAVSVNEQDSALVAQVHDDGPGFDLDTVTSNYHTRGSLGLLNMQERAEIIEGHLTIDSAPGSGTTVRLVVPVPHRPAPQ